MSQELAMALSRAMDISVKDENLRPNVPMRHPYFDNAPSDYPKLFQMIG